MFPKSIWIPILIVVLAVIGCGLFYGNRRKAQQEPIKVYKPVEVQQSGTQKPPPPGETHETGHWHGDVWHSEPHDAHSPVEVATPEIQVPPIGVQNTNPIAEGLDVSNPSSDETVSSQSKKISKEAFDAWVEWENKYIELSEKLSQIGKEGAAIAPATADEWERYFSDTEYKKEVDRKRKEASDKFFEVMRLIQTHEEKRVFPPGMPTSSFTK